MIGKYIWKNKATDQIVNVIGVLGEGPDGKIYLKIEGSNVGIPLDECTKVNDSRKPNKSSISIIAGEFYRS